MSDNGKGDAPRTGQDQEAYEDSWKRIFGDKLKSVDEHAEDE